MKEVVDGPIIGMLETMERLGFVKGSVLVRLTGDMPFIESIDVAGEIPSETKDRRFRGCWIVSKNGIYKSESYV